MMVCTRQTASCLILVGFFAAGQVVVHAGSVADTAGDAIEVAADIVAADVSADEQSVRFAVHTAQVYEFANTQILLDTDGDAKTGFADGTNGFDVLIEGAGLFRFQGSDQTQWNWQRQGEVRRSVSGTELAVHLPRTALRGAQFDLLVRTLTSGYAEVDRAPNVGVRQVDLEAIAGAGAPKERGAKETSGDVAEAARDLVACSVSQQGGIVVVEVTTLEATDFAQLLVFFDTDGKIETGYQSGSAAERGFDMLLSGGRLLRFNGDRPTVWAWDGLADASATAEGKRYRAVFDAGLLKTTRADVVAMMMSADWQTVVDLAPDRGAIELRIDAGQTKPRLPAPQVAEPRANRHLPPRERFARAKSFYCYYGSGRVAELSHYDILIAHAPQMVPADIARLKELGVVVVGYLSVGEDSKLREGDGKGPGGYASWYLDEDQDGQPDQNGIWKSYYANAGDPAWRADRVARARRLRAEDGYDGIFLDTLDTASAFPQTEPGMITLVRELRKALPDAPIVLNQGYPLLAKLAPLADGMMIESFTATYDFRTREYVMHSPSSLDWTRGVAERIIRPVVDPERFKVLVLDYALPGDRDNIQTAADRAATFGYLFAAAPIHLDAVYQTGIRGRPDPKWLRRQATPESLQYTLAQAANGFPAKTMLIPSGCYSGYRVQAVVDGIEDRADLYWADAAWASAEDGDEAWLELRFPEPLSSGTLLLRWAVDNGRLHASRQYRVEVRRKGEWVPVDRIEGNTREVCEHQLPGESFDAVRILQPAGCGSPQRPDLMWLAQVERHVDS